MTIRSSASCKRLQVSAIETEAELRARAEAAEAKLSAIKDRYAECTDLLEAAEARIATLEAALRRGLPRIHEYTACRNDGLSQAPVCYACAALNGTDGGGDGNV